MVKCLQGKLQMKNTSKSSKKQDEKHKISTSSKNQGEKDAISKNLKNQDEKKGLTVRDTSGLTGNFVKMTEIRNKLLTFRDLLDLSPCVGSASVNEVHLLPCVLKGLLLLHRAFARALCF